MKVNGGSEERTIKKTLRVTGTGAITANVLQVTGTVRVLNQFATITDVTTLVNATAVYSTAYDGTNSIDLTADGAVLSGCPVNTFFTKDKDSSEIYTISKADQVRKTEVSAEAEISLPFTVTQPFGIDTFIRLHLTTTDNPVDFTVALEFKYIPLSPDGNLVFL